MACAVVAAAAPDEAGMRPADGMGGRISRRSGSSASRIGVAADERSGGHCAMRGEPGRAHGVADRQSV